SELGQFFGIAVFATVTWFTNNNLMLWIAFSVMWFGGKLAIDQVERRNVIIAGPDERAQKATLNSLDPLLLSVFWLLTTFVGYAFFSLPLKDARYFAVILSVVLFQVVTRMILNRR